MSTIVVVKKAGRAVIAGDTLMKFGSMKVESKYIRNRDKIVSFNDTYVGIVGASAHQNVFERLIRKHPQKLSFKNIGDIFDTFLGLHPIFKEEFYMNPHEEDNQEYESSQMDILIANPHGIFGCYSWREVFEYETFWAIGSGARYALGAMHSANEMLDTPEEIAHAGISASCEFDEDTGLPPTSYSVQLLPARPVRSRKR